MIADRQPRPASTTRASGVWPASGRSRRGGGRLQLLQVRGRALRAPDRAALKRELKERFSVSLAERSTKRPCHAQPVFAAMPTAPLPWPTICAHGTSVFHLLAWGARRRARPGRAARHDRIGDDPMAKVVVTAQRVHRLARRGRPRGDRSRRDGQRSPHPSPPSDARFEDVDLMDLSSVLAATRGASTSSTWPRSRT